MTSSRCAHRPHPRIGPPLVMVLLFAACAPPSARRETTIGIADAGKGESPGTEPDGLAEDRGVPNLTDAVASDLAPNSDQRPGQADLLADRTGAPDAAPSDTALPDAPVPDAAPPDMAPPPDTSPPDRPPPRVLFVVIAPPVLTTDDERIRGVLQARNMVVTLGDDDGLATQAAGMDLVVISGSVSSAAVGTKYTNLTLPVLTMESFGFGNMGMTGMNRNTDYGSTDLTDIAIALPAHALAAGFPAGNLTVTTAATRLGWGVTAPQADNVATVVGMPNRATIFSYEPGRMMVGLPAPARRVGIFPLSPSPDLLNAAGLRLLGAALDWITRP
jgi:hypothetical protein